VLPPRAVGVLALALPLALAGRMRITPRAAPLVIAAGVAEVLGFVAFTSGARHDIAIASVLSSLFGVFAALIARVVFSERLSRPQTLGVTTIALGIVALGVLER
jgi:drug/metabolite transporter (DMT)-like permease